MIIQKITLCNLNSIQGEQTIDFTKEPLRSTGLFAITGDTGAGKSTILDAICLALYNRAPRFDNVELLATANAQMQGDDDAGKRLQAKDPRNMLRRGQREGYAIVEFSTQDGSVYEAGWRVRVKRTGTVDRVGRTLRRLSPKSQNIDEREIAQRIPEIIGLDYDQFSRTVLLAQNSFANFLKARRSEKSALLEKLTGTEIYGAISRQIYRLTDEARRNKEALENQLAGILRDRLEPEPLAELEQRKEFLTTACRTIDERLSALQKGLDWLNRKLQAEQQLERSEKEYNEAYKVCVAARDDEQKVSRYDAVLDIQPTYQEIVMRRQDIEQLKAQEEGLKRQIAAREEQLLQTKAQLQTTREATLKAENTLVQQRSVITRGHTLTGEIKEGQLQLDKAQEALNEARHSLQNRQNRHNGKMEELRKTQEALDKHLHRQQELSVHKVMFDKFDLLKDKLTQFDNEFRRKEEEEKKAAELQQKLQSATESARRLEATEQNNQAKMNSLKSELLIHQQTNSGQSGERLQQQFAASKNRLLRLRHAAALWKHITEGYEEIGNRQAGISRSAVEQEQMQTDIERLEREYRVADEVYQRLHVALTLSHSENIVALRKRLKEGTACPVCGATHHPYHTETERELGELLAGLEKDDSEAYEKLRATTQRLEELRQRLATGQGRLVAERQALAQCIQRQNADVDSWQEYADLDPTFGDCSPTVNSEARRLMIELHADNANKSATEIEEELSAFNFHQSHINRLNEEIAALAGSMEENQVQLQALRTQQQIASVSLEEVNCSLYISGRTYDQLYRDLDEMITLADWFNTWRTNYDGFRTRLTGLHDNWLQTCRELDNCRHSEELLHEETKTTALTVAEAERNLARANDNYQAVGEGLRLKREEFGHLFPDRSPEAVEEQLNRQIEMARTAENAAREAHESAERSIGEMRGARQRVGDDILARQEECRIKSHELDLWLLRFNSQHPPMQMQELRELFSDATDWKALRARLNAYRENLRLTEHRLQIAREHLLQIQSDKNRPQTDDAQTVPTETMLRDDIAATEEQSRQLREELSTIGVTLTKHYSCLADAERRQSDIDAARHDFSEWESINTLLGSADGKRFRELAQSYTFGFLVEQANYHLRMLSPRYELSSRIGTLSLTVIDHDMFDEERYVQSLSGGETFVVSLALALGLSSLSTGQIAIGSLFIDEGFGNLDQASLALVMDALARLETTQGRKVGVVSHTPQIRSQIHPQIRLVKHPTGGRSEIRVE